MNYPESTLSLETYLVKMRIFRTEQIIFIQHLWDRQNSKMPLSEDICPNLWDFEYDEMPVIMLN